jgi:hypothetical protein
MAKQSHKNYKMNMVSDNSTVSTVNYIHGAEVNSKMNFNKSNIGYYK